MSLAWQRVIVVMCPSLDVRERKGSDDLKSLARRHREEEKFINTIDKGSLEILQNTFGGSESVDSEAQTDQVLSQSPIWLKIKVKGAITGKR